MKKLIYVVEDEEAIRELYALAITGADFDAECFVSGEELFKRLPDHTPDLFILDVMLDGMNGYEILEKIRTEKKLSTIPVIMVSARNEEVSKVKGLNLGADDYITKPFGVLELIARINAALRRGGSKNTDLLTYKDIIINDDLHEITVNLSVCAVTLKEYNLIKLLVERAETVVVREEILSKIWGTDFFGETRTLDMHIAKIRQTLLDNDSKTSIVTVRGVGYMLK